MRQLIDLRCPDCNRTVERYISDITCPCLCGGTMHKIIGMPKIALDGTDDGFPGAYSKWADLREQNASIKSKRSYHGE